MSVTPATEDGYRKIPGADHPRPVWHWKLTPGTAYHIDDLARTNDEVEITPAMAKRAVPTYNLRFIAGRSVVVFMLDNKQIAQPIAFDKDPVLRGAKPRPLPPPPKGDSGGAAEAPPARPSGETPASEPKPKKKKITYEPL